MCNFQTEIIEHIMEVKKILYVSTKINAVKVINSVNGGILEKFNLDGSITDLTQAKKASSKLLRLITVDYGINNINAFLKSINSAITAQKFKGLFFDLDTSNMPEYEANKLYNGLDFIAVSTGVALYTNINFLKQ